MALEWSGWQQPEAAENAHDPGTPYTDWYVETDLAGRGEREGARFARVSQAGAAEALTPALGAGFALPWLPLPKKAAPGGGLNLPGPREDVLAGLAEGHLPAEGDVIVGVIDAGLALAHERFRRMGGVGTRILSCWRQGGAWQGQAHLPFGQELMQAEIDALMGPSPAVDEAAFNRAAGSVDFADPHGERWIETLAPHGTHVADLAAGCDLLTAADRLRDRTHLVLVDLAPRLSIGPSGSFLEFYAIWAIRHIVETADAIWQARFPDQPERRFPVVINMSYGLHAGPKDGNMAIQKYVSALNAGRDPRQPVRILLPAGNDNLDQGSAVLGGERGTARALNWRILPEDRTSSYAEVWFDPVDLAETGETPEVQIGLTPPFGTPALLPPGRPGQFCDLRDGTGGPVVARVYCLRNDSRLTGQAMTRLVKIADGYVLCVAPTWRVNGQAAPHGGWTISVGEGPLAKIYVQSDQMLAPGDGSSLLSYLEPVAGTAPADRYERYLPDGGLRDTYGFDPVTGAGWNADSPGPVRRQNTMNAIAASDGTLTIAGYRASDGRPAPWSSSARGFGIGANSHALMDAACVSDDSAARFGRLAAGGRSGAAVAMQGTSFATAEATRIMAGLMLDWQDGGQTGPAPDAAAFQALAQGADAGLASATHSPPAAHLRLKLGEGRLPMQDHGRQAR